MATKKTGQRRAKAGPSFVDLGLPQPTPQFAPPQVIVPAGQSEEFVLTRIREAHTKWGRQNAQRATVWKRNEEYDAMVKLLCAEFDKRFPLEKSCDIIAAMAIKYGHSKRTLRRMIKPQQRRKDILRRPLA